MSEKFLAIPAPDLSGYFKIDMPPPRATYQSTRKLAYIRGKPLIIDDKRGRALRKKICTLLGRAKKTCDRACELSIVWAFPFLKSFPKKTIDTLPNGFCIANTHRPDLDNMAKLVTDCLVAQNYLSDDSVVFVLRLQKVFVAPQSAGIFVKITKEREDT